MTDIVKEHWWLMTCDLPDLNWARMRVYSNGSAEVLDCDGQTLAFLSEQEASLTLREDEFCRLDEFDSEDEQEFGITFSNLTPPVASLVTKISHD